MNVSNIFKSNGIIMCFIILIVSVLVGCGAADQPKQSTPTAEQQVPDVNNEHEQNEANDEQNDANDEMEEAANEKDDEDIANDEETDGTLEVINGNPVGEYKTGEITNYMIIKENPKTQKSMPGGFLIESHPYVKEISDSLEDVLFALYEIDYKTVTDDRHKPFLIGELSDDSKFLDLRGELGYEVITEIKSINTRGITFEDGMEKARVTSEVTYHVVQSSETPGAFHRYLEGKDYMVSATSEVEIIDGEWKVTHVLDGFAEVIEEE